MSLTNCIEWIKNFLSSLIVPAIISIFGTYLDSRLADAVDFGAEVGSILPRTWNTFFSILFSPGAFFTPNMLVLNYQYLFTALALAAFAFSYLVPPVEYSKKKWLDWVLKILFSKIASAINKGGILLLSSMYIVGYFLVFGIITFLSGNSGYGLHFILLGYSIGTVYIAISLALFLEHFVALPVKRNSILRNFALIVDREHEPSEKERECSRIVDHKSEAYDLKRPQWLQHIQNEKAIEGRKQGAIFMCVISAYQRIMIYSLMLFLIVFPFYCLFMANI